MTELLLTQEEKQQRHEQVINDRIAHLTNLIKFLKSRPIFDEHKIPSFEHELKALKEVRKTWRRDR